MRTACVAEYPCAENAAASTNVTRVGNRIGGSQIGYGRSSLHRRWSVDLPFYGARRKCHVLRTNRLCHPRPYARSHATPEPSAQVPYHFNRPAALQRSDMLRFFYNPNLSRRYSRQRDLSIRSWLASSRLRTVTVPSSLDWPSIVKQKGVPASSMRA